MYEGLVGIDDLLQVNTLVCIVGESGILIKLLVGLNDVLNRGLGFDDRCAEDATCKVTTIGDEIDVGIEIALNLFQRLANLGDVLMLEGLVDAQVVVTPREVGSGSWLLTSSCAACDSVDSNIFLQQIQVGGR